MFSSFLQVSTVVLDGTLRVFYDQLMTLEHNRISNESISGI